MGHHFLQVVVVTGFRVNLTTEKEVARLRNQTQKQVRLTTFICLHAADTQERDFNVLKCAGHANPKPSGRLHFKTWMVSDSGFEVRKSERKFNPFFFFFFSICVQPALFVLLSGQRGGAAADQQDPGGLGPDGCKVPPVERAQRGAGSGNRKGRQSQGLRSKGRLPGEGHAAPFPYSSSPTFFPSASGGLNRSGGSSSSGEGRRLQAEPERGGAAGGRRAVRKPPGHSEGLVEPGRQPGAGTVHRIAAGFNKQGAERAGHRELLLHLGWGVDAGGDNPGGARTLVCREDSPGISTLITLVADAETNAAATCPPQRETNNLPSVDLSSECV